jgi:signal transduction histidine kinase
MTERGKQHFIVLLPVLVFFIGILALSAFWLQEYRQSTFEHISKFSEIIIENSPEAETQVLSAVKEYDTFTEQEIDGNTFLAQYGYRSNEFCQKLGWSFFFFSSVVFLITACCFLVSARYVDRRNQMRIAELTNYLEQVNVGADGTVAQIKEDEFSHLQDEMYKTVTELYQTRESAVKAKINFADNLANIAHQLKTPITAAFLSLQLMEKIIPNIYAEQIKRQLERLNRLEESLLTLSKIDTGTLLLERVEVDIYTVLNLAADNLSDLLVKENVSVSIPNRGCIEITGDLEWTMEAFINLMKDCMEHSPQGGTIHCDYSRNPLYVEILLWDEGAGFCPQDIPHLFKRFYRGRSAVGNGIGIGLALAQSIFELQNGNITARNLPGGGACFEIRVYSH